VEQEVLIVSYHSVGWITCYRRWRSSNGHKDTP